MTGKMSKTARQATRAGSRKGKGGGDTAFKLAPITVLDGVTHRIVFDGRARTACGKRATFGWHYAAPGDIECAECLA